THSLNRRFAARPRSPLRVSVRLRGRELERVDARGFDPTRRRPVVRPPRPGLRRRALQVAADDAGELDAPGVGAEEPVSTEDLPHLGRAEAPADDVQDLPVLDARADLLEAGARDGCPVPRVDEDPLAAPVVRLRERVAGPAVRGQALAVENPVDTFERRPE